MPIYEYQCRDCKKEFEVMQRITDDPLTKCEACSGTLDKLISQSAFVLKGSGWYKTDFADKPKPPAGSEASEPKGTEASDCSTCPAASNKKD